MELQFWGYEVGNVLAAIAGVGGFSAFFHSFDFNEIFPNSDNSDYLNTVFYALLDGLTYLSGEPSLFVTVGIGFIVLIAPLLRRLVLHFNTIVFLGLFDFLVIALALALLLFAFKSDASWVTVSGSSFVVASAFLRYGLANPLYLKLGGVFLLLGGIALLFFGLTFASQHSTTIDQLLSLLTIATGFYVGAAGMLTYNGGIFNSNQFDKQLPRYQRLVHPRTGMVSVAMTKLFDKPNIYLVRYLVNPSIFWLSSDTKNNKPFITSMAARLPWRFFTGSVALASDTSGGLAFAAANFLWAIGDIALGSIDWQNTESSEQQSASAHEDLSVISAMVLLPGANYSNGTRAIVMAELQLTENQVRNILATRCSDARLYYIRDCDSASNPLTKKIYHHLYDCAR